MQCHHPGKRAALLAIGGQKLTEIFRTLTPAYHSYQAAKECLNEYFKPQKNLTAERYKFLCMKPGFPEETHGHWVTRLRSEVRNCEFDKMNNDEAIKLVLTLHTHSVKLQREIISKDLTLTHALEYAQALELTDKEITFMKNNSIAPENPSVQSLRKRPTKAPFGGNRTENSGPSWKQRVCRYCGRDFPPKNICPAKNVM